MTALAGSALCYCCSDDPPWGDPSARQLLPTSWPVAAQPRNLASRLPARAGTCDAQLWSDAIVSHREAGRALASS